MNIILSSSAITLFNKLIEIKGLNIKKLYSLNNIILEDNLIEFKNIHCKNRTNKNKLCLNNCIENSKYCKIHDPIMKEQKRINRLNMNIKRRLLKQAANESIKEEIRLFTNIDYELPSAPEYDQIEPKGIIGQTIESMPPPNYEQKPDECGKKIINEININKYNSIPIETIIDKTDYILKSSIRLHPLMNKNAAIMNTINNLNKEINIPNELNPLLALNKNNRPIMNIEDYKNKLNNLDYSIFDNFKGPKLHKLTENIIKIQIKAYHLGNMSIVNSNSTLELIKKVLKNIPK